MLHFSGSPSSLIDWIRLMMATSMPSMTTFVVHLEILVAFGLHNPGCICVLHLVIQFCVIYFPTSLDLHNIHPSPLPSLQRSPRLQISFKYKQECSQYKDGYLGKNESRARSLKRRKNRKVSSSIDDVARIPQVDEEQSIEQSYCSGTT